MNTPLPTASEIPMILKFGFFALAAADADADTDAETLALAISEIEDDIVVSPK
jgi:hypothetical protein